MASFSYEAVNARGEHTRGQLLADSEAHAADLLAASGLMPFALSPEHGTSLVKPARSFATERRVPLGTQAWLLDELATLLEVDVSLVEAFESLQSSHAGSPLGDGLQIVIADLRGGKTLSDSLPDSGLNLPRYVTELVRAGESTGRLPGTARAAASQLREDERFAQEVRSALIYPSVLVASGLVAMLVVFIFVVPKFASVLDNPRADIPAISLLVLKSGVWLAEHAWAVGVALILVTALGITGLRQSAVRAQLWELAGSTPLLKDWVRQAELYRWSSMLGLLLQHRVNLLAALEQSGQTLRGRWIRERGQQMSDAVRQGKSLSEVAQGQQLFDAPALSLIRVGEKGGTLGRSLETLSQRFREASQRRIQRFLVLLEPLTILLISIFLGGVMISVILAVTSLTNVI